MIEHILHAIAHAVEEHYSEENIQKRKQEEIKHKKTVEKNKPQINAIRKDCEAAVLYASRKSGVTLNTQKNKADIDLEKMAQYLIRHGYPNIYTWDFKAIAALSTLSPIKELAQAACDSICDELKIEH